MTNDTATIFEKFIMLNIIVLRRRDTKESSVFDKMLPVDDNVLNMTSHTGQCKCTGACYNELVVAFSAQVVA